MRAFVTGATGFIGGRLVHELAARGDDVTAFVRDPARAHTIADLPTVTIARGDITDPSSVRAAIAGHDAVFHLAAWYALGIRDRARMHAINVEGTRTVLDAAAEAGGARVVHCSTIAALGRARPGEVADESAPHPGTFGSVYEETKRRGHEIAVERARAGQDIVLVMPGATYGVGDQSVIGLLLRLWAKRVLIACPFQGTGLSWVAVEDVAAGMLSAHDRGLSGEGYVLGGDNATLAQAFERVGPLAGLRAPRRMPEALLRAVVPVSGPFVRMLGQEPDLLREGLASLRGSWMFSSAKAARDLGYTFRSIEDGIVATLRAQRTD